MSKSTNKRPVILTGDRTTGPLHLGHYAGSLKNRVLLQHTNQQFLLLVDTQALTDNAHDPAKVQRNVLEVAFDYLAVGIDPALTTICVQSALPALAELTILYMNFVTVARLERNPTIKTEIQLRGFERDVPAGFLCYPVSQAADITVFKATLVPVGEDQAPLIEQTNEIVRRLNRQIGHDLLPEAQAMIPTVGRIDGKAKMSKSQGNAVLLSASADEIRDAVRQMFTDPNHIRAADPGTVEGNVVFTYLDAFSEDPTAIEDLKTRYRHGGSGDIVVKRQLEEILQSLLAPIRERRARYAADPAYVMNVLRNGTAVAREITEATLKQVRDALGLFTLGSEQGLFPQAR
ncbi:tryptophan--tRNA ligase [Agrobacterium rubi]|uniref:Tryptophan--tRNA ligase n=1 Tax=Agrobacterium rubi TaxID=28099 RepID=A0AAE7RBB2_9HYPH|nr:tryptophan--tRNA ligase [Agrobacterium rubi]NTE89624.1 tryptophan--tRNA ligase [Agrobacterium rubi]NTF05526.1 tryptophan--tRNA ligase [Agrobacterium rubi]NTF39969.1 tryptophan--tRNA ligase [Agrobacterium rubi]OCJ44738.1 tryptophan--tRNA ligase [Agrobacterium rubi]QTG03838.1 tryptophan--tRNA ligase [Agrobacterium rubi]